MPEGALFPAMQPVPHRQGNLEKHGHLWLRYTPQGLCQLIIRTDHPQPLKDVEQTKYPKLLVQLQAYLSGQHTAFHVRLDLHGTPFQKRVWHAIATIPWGETRSYAWLAQAVGNLKACRAIARACGANPTPIIIPCHRVIAKDGSIGGFSGGLPRKRHLLELEGIMLP